MEPFASRVQHSRLISYLKFFGNITLLTSSLILFLVVVILTLPAVESYAYKSTTCIVNDVKVIFNSSSRQTCMCKTHSNAGTRCTIYYPCLQVFVNYTDSENVSHTAMVSRHWRDIGEHCSYKLRNSECSTKAAVYTKLESFREQWGKRKKAYSCYYKSWNWKHVLLHNESPNLTLVVNCTLWPAVGVVVGILLLMFNKRLAEFCKRTCGMNQYADHMPLMTEHEM